jgi:hypothetical protein
MSNSKSGPEFYLIKAYSLTIANSKSESQETGLKFNEIIEGLPDLDGRIAEQGPRFSIDDVQS